MSRELVSRVLVAGGTHGNELTGAYLIKNWDQVMTFIPESFVVSKILGNPRAIQEKRRYCDQDLNRCFTVSDLDNSLLVHYEAVRAKEIYHQYGAHSEQPTDFVIDLHTTTTRMGATIVVLSKDGFMFDLISYLVQCEPDINVFFEPGDLASAPYLYSIGKFGGILIEIGEVAQGLLRADIFLKTARLIEFVFKFFDAWNQNKMFVALSTDIEAYQFIEKVNYPKTVDGSDLAAMIHPALQGRDYQALHPGDPVFMAFNGEVIAYEGKEELYPAFINEAAYYDSLTAFSLMRKIKLVR